MKAAAACLVLLLALISSSPCHAAVMHTPGSVVVTTAANISPVPTGGRVWQTSPLSSSVYSCHGLDMANCPLLFDGTPVSGVPTTTGAEYMCFNEGDSVTFDWGSSRAVTKVSFDNYCNNNAQEAPINPAHNVHAVKLLTSDDGVSWTLSLSATEMIAPGDDLSQTSHADQANWTNNIEATCDRVDLLPVPRAARFLRFEMGPVLNSACLHQLGVYNAPAVQLNGGKLDTTDATPFKTEDPFTRVDYASSMLSANRLVDSFSCEGASAGFESSCAKLFDESSVLAHYNAEISEPVQGEWSDISGNGNNGFLSPEVTVAGSPGARSLVFDGTGALVQLPFSKTDLASRDGRWTVAAWVRYTGLATDTYRMIVGTNKPGPSTVLGLSGGTTFAIGKDRNTDTLFVQDDAKSTHGALFPSAAARSLFDGGEHSIVVTRDGTNLEVFVDGQALPEGPMPSPGGSPSSHLMAIGTEESTYQWEGDIAQVIFLQSDVSAASARALHNRMAQRTAFSMTAVVDQPDVLALYSAKISNAENGEWQDLTGNHAPGILAKVGGGGSLPVASGETMTFASSKVMTGFTTGDLQSGLTREWTIAAWIKYTGATGAGESYAAFVGSQPVGDYKTQGGGGTDLFIGKDRDFGGSGGTKLCIQWVSYLCWTASTNAISDGQHHSVVVTYDGGTSIELFVDGASKGVVSSGNYAQGFIEEIAIGDESNSLAWQGQIDEVVFMTRRLSASEASAVHQRMSTGMQFTAVTENAMCLDDGGSVTVQISQTETLWVLRDLAIETFCNADSSDTHELDRLVLATSRDGHDWHDVGGLLNMKPAACQWFNMELGELKLMRWLRVTVFAKPGATNVCLTGLRAFGQIGVPPQPKISTPNMELLPDVQQWFVDAVNASVPCVNCYYPEADGHRWAGHDLFQHPGALGDAVARFAGPFNCGQVPTDATVVRTQTRFTAIAKNTNSGSDGVFVSIVDDNGVVLLGPEDVFYGAPVSIDIDISHVNAISLVVNPREADSSDHLWWEGAQLTCSFARPGAVVSWTPQTTLKGLETHRRIGFPLPLQPHQFQCSDPVSAQLQSLSSDGFGCDKLFDGVPRNELEYLASVRSALNKDTLRDFWFHAMCFMAGEFVQQNFDHPHLVEAFEFENYCNNNNHNADNITLLTSMDGATWNEAVSVTGLNDGVWAAASCDHIRVSLDEPILARHVRLSGSLSVNEQDGNWAHFCLPELAFYGTIPRPTRVNARDVQRWCSMRKS